MNTGLRRFMSAKQGQARTEYTLLVGLIGFGVWAILSTTGLGDWLTTLFSPVKREIPLCAEASPGCVPSTPAPGEGPDRSGLSR